ncbi:MAG: glycosyltransferase family 4 protein [Candidatus Omnitrophica bacterium]|nr:glycosyltransferase family 4 protein [Candidatus Omnitrophota bacterium]
MKILHICHLYPPSVGGVQVLMKELSEKLVECGDQVDVFTANAMSVGQFFDRTLKGKSFPRDEVVNGVRIKRFPIRHGFYNLLFNKIRTMPGGSRLINFIFKDAVEHLKWGPFTPDMIVACTAYMSTTYFCYLMKKIMGVPLVVMPSLRMDQGWRDAPIVDKILKQADLNIAFTEFEKKILLTKGIEEKKISVVGNAIDPSMFLKAEGQSFREKHQLNKSPTITFLARKTKGKGVLTLMDAMKIVWQQMGDVQLILAGEKRPDCASAIEDRLLAMNENDRKKVFDIDEFPTEERAEIYAAGDVFVMPSDVDSFGIVYLEAWACGKPVIACKNTAPASYIEDGVDGLLVEYGNTNELAEAILSILKDKEKGSQLGKNGRDKVLENYTWDIIAKKMRCEYREFLDRKTRKFAF